MRIAQVAPPWLSVPPHGYGGIELVVALLTDDLVERGHDVTLFAPGDSQTTARLEAVFESAPGPDFINSIWHDTMQSLHAYRDPSRFDLIHEHTVWSGLVAASLIDVPVVHTLHGAFTPQMQRIYELLADRLWFVAISEDQRRRMPDLRYAGVVHNGIDLSAYPYREDKEDFLLFLGRANPDKGALRAVEAAKAAGLSLVMAVKVAQAEEKAHWARDVLPSITEDMTVLGELSLEEKTDLISRARAVLFPIDWDEPFGLVMTEAMACGTPVIATPRGSVPEVIADQETGFIVPVDAYPDEAARSVKRLDEIDPRACRDRVERLFSRGAMASGYEDAYRIAIRGGSATKRGEV